MSSRALNRRTLALAACMLLAACSAQPARNAPPPAQPVTKSQPQAAAAPAAAASAAPASASGTSPGPAPHPDVPPAARADFERAVRYMRAGNATEAELDFKQIALQYPQFATPLRGPGPAAAQAGSARAGGSVAAGRGARKEVGNAVAWTELGVTQRMRGEFKDAAASYEKAIAADAHYAPA